MLAYRTLIETSTHVALSKEAAALLQVLFTTNGKEYLTPKQLRNEVEDEIMVRGGRVNITELATVLNVDLDHIERVVNMLLTEKPTDSAGGLQLFQVKLRLEPSRPLSHTDSFPCRPDTLSCLISPVRNPTVAGGSDRRLLPRDAR